MFVSVDNEKSRAIGLRESMRGPACVGGALSMQSLLAFPFLAGWTSLFTLELLTFSVGFGSGMPFPVATVSVHNRDRPPRPCPSHAALRRAVRRTDPRLAVRIIR